jgi:hypothetical protein
VALRRVAGTFIAIASAHGARPGANVSACIHNSPGLGAHPRAAAGLARTCPRSRATRQAAAHPRARAAGLARTCPHARATRHASQRLRAHGRQAWREPVRMHAQLARPRGTSAHSARPGANVSACSHNPPGPRRPVGLARTCSHARATRHASQRFRARRQAWRESVRTHPQLARPRGAVPGLARTCPQASATRQAHGAAAGLARTCSHARATRQVSERIRAREPGPPARRARPRPTARRSRAALAPAARARRRRASPARRPRAGWPGPPRRGRRRSGSHRRSGARDAASR